MQMYDDFEPGGSFERRRSNRAILMVVALAFAGIALDDGVRSLKSPAGESRPRVKRLVPEADRNERPPALSANAPAGECPPYEVPHH
jgi:hypothetical protein